MTQCCGECKWFKVIMMRSRGHCSIPIPDSFDGFETSPMYPDEGEGCPCFQSIAENPPADHQPESLSYTGA